MSSSTSSRPLRVAGIVFAAALGVVAIALVLVAAWVGVRGALAYSHLRDAQQTASLVRADLTDPAKAADAVALISADTSAARELTSDPLWRAAESLPWFGSQLEAVSTVAAALDEVAGTAIAPLADVASSFSVDSLRPVEGRIDLSGFAGLQDAATTGADGVASANASLDRLDRRALLAPVRDAVDEVAGLLGEVETAAGAVARATVLLPAMLGADGPRDYLVLFQNNAEWRSLGGAPGALALLHTDAGAISLAAQESSSDFPSYGTSVLPLDDEIRALYGERPGKWSQNLTQVPDFAVTGPLAREMWAREHDGQQVDGVIALDPVALSYLLEATGPVTLPTGDVLTSENAVSLLLNEAYQRYERPRDLDAFFAAAAAAVFDALASGNVDPATLVSALARAGEDHRLLLWSAHEDDQRLLADTTLAGGLPVTDAETARFGVFLNDGTGSKMDFYGSAAMEVTWVDCTATPSGTTGTAQLMVTVTNNAPPDAANLPAYITGGEVYGVALGSARTVGYIYLPEGFALEAATMDDGGGFGGGVHDGRRVVSFVVELAPGQSAVATVLAGATTPGADTLAVSHTPLLTSVETPTATCG